MIKIQVYYLSHRIKSLICIQYLEQQMKTYSVKPRILHLRRNVTLQLRTKLSREMSEDLLSRLQPSQRFRKDL